MHFGICTSGDVSQAPTRDKEHHARDAVHLYKETLREDMLEFGDSSTVECKLTKHELKAAERAAAVQAGDVAKAARIDAREEKRRRLKAYHSVSARIVPGLLKTTKVVKVVTST